MSDPHLKIENFDEKFGFRLYIVSPRDLIGMILACANDPDLANVLEGFLDYYNNPENELKTCLMCTKELPCLKEVCAVAALSPANDLTYEGTDHTSIVNVFCEECFPLAVQTDRATFIEKVKKRYIELGLFSPQVISVDLNETSPAKMN